MQKILIVEDDKKLRNELEKFLNNNGYEAEGLKSYDNCIHDILQSNSDLILLDINLPFSDGEYICKEVRKSSDVPIIMITSRNNEMDELMCINYGADDFVTKPYNPLILIARIEAVLKRMQPASEILISYQDIKLDVSKSSILKDDRVIELSKNELNTIYVLRKSISNISNTEATEQLINIITSTKNNNEFLSKIEYFFKNK